MIKQRKKRTGVNTSCRLIRAICVASLPSNTCKCLRRNLFISTLTARRSGDGGGGGGYVTRAYSKN